jgi:photosystem II stability/assembly factor-like uncharacterized protein
LHWLRVALPAEFGDVSVSCPNKNICHLAAQLSTEDGAVGATTKNGGLSFTVQKLPSQLLSVGQLVCPSVTWCELVGTGSNGGIVFGTAETGSGWTSQSIPDTGVSSLNSVSCFASTCTAVAKFEAIGTTDGGATWFNETIPGFPDLLSVACPSQIDCVAVGLDPSDHEAVAVDTTDGGTVWAPETLPVGIEQLSSVACISATACVAVGTAATEGGAAVATTNGGANWTLQSLPLATQAFSSLTCPSTQVCFASTLTQILRYSLAPAGTSILDHSLGVRVSRT